MKELLKLDVITEKIKGVFDKNGTVAKVAKVITTICSLINAIYVIWTLIPKFDKLDGVDGDELIFTLSRHNEENQ